MTTTILARVRAILGVVGAIASGAGCTQLIGLTDVPGSGVATSGGSDASLAADEGTGEGDAAPPSQGSPDGNPDRSVVGSGDVGAGDAQRSLPDAGDQSCVPGVDCSDPAAPCVTRKIDCASGHPVCTVAQNARDGTGCGTGQYCYGGVCESCALDKPCQPANPCHAGTVTSCAGGAMTCTDQSTASNEGKSCGAGQICAAGACVACNASTCPHGCCGASGCVAAADQSADQCGVGGAACVACASLKNVSGPTSCNAGQCAVPATSCASGWAHCSSNP